MLDFIVVAQGARDWKAEAKVIARLGDFPDDAQASDHRPVEAVFDPAASGVDVGGPTDCAWSQSRQKAISCHVASRLTEDSEGVSRRSALARGWWTPGDYRSFSPISSKRQIPLLIRRTTKKVLALMHCFRLRRQYLAQAYDCWTATV